MNQTFLLNHPILANCLKSNVTNVSYCSKETSRDVSYDVSHSSRDGLPIHKIRIEQIVMIKEKTEIARAFLDYN